MLWALMLINVCMLFEIIWGPSKSMHCALSETLALSARLHFIPVQSENLKDSECLCWILVLELPQNAHQRTIL